jgi:soluble lytic murein transglycosylase-like protein
MKRYFLIIGILGVVIKLLLLFNANIGYTANERVEQLLEDKKQLDLLRRVDSQVQSELDRLAEIRPAIPAAVATEILCMARKYEIELELVCATIKQESDWQHDARSHKGAIGLMQVMPMNAVLYGFTSKDLYDPIINVQCGTRYLSEAVKKFGLIGGLVAYNAGPGRAKKWLRKGDSALLAETRDYVPAVMKFYKKFKKS